MINARDVEKLAEAKRRLIFEQYQDAITACICDAIDKSGDAKSTVLDIPGLVSVWPVRMNPLPSADQTAVIEELFTKFDYGAALVPDESTFVPKGLKQNNGPSSRYRKFLIQIAW
jgi:hypothetical protein